MSGLTLANGISHPDALESLVKSVPALYVVVNAASVSLRPASRGRRVS